MSWMSEEFGSAYAGTLVGIPATLAGIGVGMATCFTMQALGGDEAVTTICKYTLGALSTYAATRKITHFAREEVNALNESTGQSFDARLHVKAYYFGALFPPTIAAALLP